jgi:hypothetical protein
MIRRQQKKRKYGSMWEDASGAWKLMLDEIIGEIFLSKSGFLYQNVRPKYQRFVFYWFFWNTNRPHIKSKPEGYSPCSLLGLEWQSNKFLFGIELLGITLK